MNKAYLKEEDLDGFSPITNYYFLDGGEYDGNFVLVTSEDPPALNFLESTMGMVVPIAKSHLPDHVHVFLSDENRTVVDADGVPENGMNPIASTDKDSIALIFMDNVHTHEEALNFLGYETVRK